MRAARKELCLRAREWASLRLDGELSEFEEALLNSHLADCISCTDFVGRVESVTEQVRATPFEAFERSVIFGRHRRISWRATRAAAAGAAVVATIGLASGLVLRSSNLKLGPNPAAGSLTQPRDFRIMRAAQMRQSAQVTALKVRSPIQ